jgi:hypothetical protein
MSSCARKNEVSPSDWSPAATQRGASGIKGMIHPRLRGGGRKPWISLHACEPCNLVLRLPPASRPMGSKSMG